LSVESGSQERAPKVRRLGRYLVHRELASGGMASVYIGRLIGPAGFARPVAIKRLHEHLARMPEFVAMFLDEAHIAARVQHPNVVPTLDVVAIEGELFLVMEFILGESLARLLSTLGARNELVPVPIAAAIATGMLLGLHAAHEAKNEEQEPLSIIHRDVSPQNLLLGVDGTPRVVDFGVAKAIGRLQTTREGQLKGKLAYMPPEQVRQEELDRRADIYAASVVFWEMLTGHRLYQGDAASIVYQIMEAEVAAPSALRPEIPAALDAVILKGLSQKREDRYATALEMVEAIEQAVSPATAARVARWLKEIAGGDIEQRSKLVAELESTDPDAPPITSRHSEDGGSDAEAPKTSADSVATRVEAAAAPSTEVEEAFEEAPVATRRPTQRRQWVWVAGIGLGVGAVAAITAFSWSKKPAETSNLPASQPSAPMSAAVKVTAQPSSVPLEPTAAAVTPTAESTTAPTTKAHVVPRPTSTAKAVEAPPTTAAPTTTVKAPPPVL
jgi:serine/threonine-protein kinase